ncbi:CapA family protein [Streptomyces goshikiensis]|uniref:CapA family protein n=1 Tax=Streptomyces goshikiensis TaxID=1942 RepID=A0ABZ1RD94_9ACTN
MEPASCRACPPPGQTCAQANNHVLDFGRDGLAETLDSSAQPAAYRRCRRRCRRGVATGTGGIAASAAPRGIRAPSRAAPPRVSRSGSSQAASRSTGRPPGLRDAHWLHAVVTQHGGPFSTARATAATGRSPSPRWDTMDLVTAVRPARRPLPVACEAQSVSSFAPRVTPWPSLESWKLFGWARRAQWLVCESRGRALH